MPDPILDTGNQWWTGQRRTVLKEFTFHRGTRESIFLYDFLFGVTEITVSLKWHIYIHILGISVVGLPSAGNSFWASSFQIMLGTRNITHSYSRGAHSSSFFFFFSLHLWHEEVPGPGIKAMLQQRPKPLQWQWWTLNLLHHKGTLGNSREDRKGNIFLWKRIRAVMEEGTITRKRGKENFSVRRDD